MILSPEENCHLPTLHFQCLQSLTTPEIFHSLHLFFLLLIISPFSCILGEGGGGGGRGGRGGGRGGRGEEGKGEGKEEKNFTSL